MKKILAMLVCVASTWSVTAFAVDNRPRLLVLTDIGGDPDDQQSLVRLLVHANEFKIEGLIASASGTPGELKKAIVKPELILEQLDAYELVFPSLTNHAAGFPSPNYLRSITKSGNPQRGWKAIGKGQSTEGSKLIVEAANRDISTPLNITIWGGQTDLAQACWDVREEQGEDGLRKFLSNIRVHDIADQDGIFDWMNGEFGFPFYVLNQAKPGRDKREAVFRGMYLGGDESLTSREWVELNVRTGHGPLGALYPPKTWTAPNPHATLKEGDTPSWFFFLPHGLNDPNFPSYGGWGGRFAMDNGVWRDAIDTVDGVTDGRSTVSRWRQAFQNSFEARLDWCVNDFHRANHAPVATIQDESTRNLVRMEGRAGTRINLSAKKSFDPDGDDLRYRWWHYREPGSYRGEFRIKKPNEPPVSLKFLR